MYVLLSKLSNINRTKHKNFLNLDQQSILLYIKNTYIFCFICCYRPKEKKLDKMNNLLYFFIRASDQQPSLESRNQDLSHGVCATIGGAVRRKNVEKESALRQLVPSGGRKPNGGGVKVKNETASLTKISNFINSHRGISKHRFN